MIRMRRSRFYQRKRLPRKFLIIRSRLFDLQELIGCDITKHLPSFADRPLDFHFRNFLILPQTEMLSQWRSSERTAAADFSVTQRLFAGRVCQTQFDLCADGGSIGFRAGQSDRNPIALATWIPNRALLYLSPGMKPPTLTYKS